MKYHLKKPHWQRGDLNLRGQYQSTALLSTRPFASQEVKAYELRCRVV